MRPNHADFTIQFTADGETPAIAGAHLAARADSVRRALMGVGIARDSLVTGSNWYWWSERLQKVTRPHLVPVAPPGRGFRQAADTIYRENGWETRPAFDTTYRAREIIQIRMGDPTKVAAAIDAALAAGITEISGIRFSATDVTEARLTALREATTRAREQAEVIASASGGRLGRILGLTTQPEYSDRYGIDAIVVSGVMEGTARTEITAPSVVVTVTVYGRWQLLER